jgi:hypothetical protein
MLSSSRTCTRQGDRNDLVRIIGLMRPLGQCGTPSRQHFPYAPFIAFAFVQIQALQQRVVTLSERRRICVRVVGLAEQLHSRFDL